MELDTVLRRDGDYTDPDTGYTMPLYEAGDFINTCIGWNMYAAAQRGEISIEDYRAARREHEATEEAKSA